MYEVKYAKFSGNLIQRILNGEKSNYDRSGLFTSAVYSVHVYVLEEGVQRVSVLIRFLSTALINCHLYC